MPLNEIATAIYEELRPLVPMHEARICYSTLVDRVNDRLSLDHPLEAYHDTRLYSALGDIAAHCQEKQLPPLTSIVVLSETKIPSTGYFKQQYPHLKNELDQIGAWLPDYRQTCATVFPPLE